MHAVPTLWLLLSLYEELFDPPPALSFLQEKNTTEENIRRKKRNRAPVFIIMKLDMNPNGKKNPKV
jgi:hypothetical protein